MSFINARNTAKEDADVSGEELLEYEKILDDTIKIVEERLHIKIDRDSFNFARYTKRRYHAEYAGCTAWSCPVKKRERLLRTAHQHLSREALCGSGED